MKKLICFFTAVLLMVTCFPAHSFAGQSEVGFYASSATQKEIYECLKENEELQSLLDYYQLRIVKASVAPIYTVDADVIMTTAEVDIFPLENNGGIKYTVKLVDQNDAFAGNLIFAYNGKTVEQYTLPAQPQDIQEAGYYREASFSYADQAERIKTLLWCESIVSPEAVRLLYLDGIGYFYYVNKESVQVFITVGKEICGTIVDSDNTGSPAEMYNIAEIINLLNQAGGDDTSDLENVVKMMMAAEGLEYKGMDDYWERLNSGELDFFKFRFYGYGHKASIQFPVVQNIPNIEDIEEYFKANIPGYTGAKGDASILTSVWFWIACAVIAVGTVALCVISCKKKTSKV